MPGSGIYADSRPRQESKGVGGRRDAPCRTSLNLKSRLTACHPFEFRMNTRFHGFVFN